MELKKGWHFRVGRIQLEFIFVDKDFQSEIAAEKLKKIDF